MNQVFKVSFQASAANSTAVALRDQISLILLNIEIGASTYISFRKRQEKYRHRPFYSDGTKTGNRAFEKRILQKV